MKRNATIFLIGIIGGILIESAIATGEDVDSYVYLLSEILHYFKKERALN